MASLVMSALSLTIACYANTALGCRAAGFGGIKKSGSSPPQVWERVLQTLSSVSEGTLEYRTTLGSSKVNDGAHLKAVWTKNRLWLQVVSPEKEKGSLFVGEGLVLEHEPGFAQSFSTPRSAHTKIDPGFSTPFSMESALTAFQDPLAPTPESVGVPTALLDRGKTWEFSFGGGVAPAFHCEVDKVTMLPVHLARAGGGMPDLAVTYKISPPDFAAFEQIKRERLPKSILAPSNGVAFERSKFRRRLEKAKLGSFRGP